MTCKDSLVSLLNELISLFENGNRLVYTRLILLRHHVRNQLDDKVIQDACRTFYFDNISDFNAKDINMFKSTTYFTNIEMIWSELSLANRSRVWLWVNAIVNDLI